jgi:hypothetical protein
VLILVLGKKNYKNLVPHSFSYFQEPRARWWCWVLEGIFSPFKISCQILFFVLRNHVEVLILVLGKN